eukprot:2867-Eustigmatos_ZCMA.PRE.1
MIRLSLGLPQRAMLDSGPDSESRHDVASPSSHQRCTVTHGPSPGSTDTSGPDPSLELSAGTASLSCARSVDD